MLPAVSKRESRMFLLIAFLLEKRARRRRRRNVSTGDREKAGKEIAEEEKGRILYTEVFHFSF